MESVLLAQLLAVEAVQNSSFNQKETSKANIAAINNTIGLTTQMDNVTNPMTHAAPEGGNPDRKFCELYRFVMVGIILSCLCLVCCAGNSLSFLVLRQKPRTPTKLLLLSLAVCDVALGL